MLNDAVTARSSAQLDAAIWQALSADEQAAFTALLKEPEPIALDCGF